MKIRFAVAALSLAALACGGPEVELEEALKASGGQGGKKSPSSSVGYALKTTDALSSEPVYKTRFPIHTTYTVFIATEISGSLSGRHTQTVYLFAPNGDAYQRIDVAFATDVPAGYGEQQAEKTASGWRVWVSFPVAATAIETSALTGIWTAQLYVDGAATPNARGSFELY